MVISMSGTSEIDPGFTWGDSVLVVREAPERFRPQSKGSVCGMTKIDTKFLEEHYSVPMGTFVYTVEFSDGHSIEIPEKYLQKLN
jgi:hypothetical protein